MNKVMFLLLTSFVLFGFSSCQCKPIIEYVDRPVEVFVPVPVPVPEPPVVNVPFLPIDLLKDEDITDPEKIVKSYVKSIILLENYSETMQCVLDAYRTESEKQCKVE